MFQRLALIGCGLIGGSFALAAKRTGLVREAVGYSLQAASSQLALERGAIDTIANSAGDAVAQADLVLVAVPVGASAEVFDALREHLLPTTLLMDVGSTKRDVVRAAQANLGERLSNFVPAHPIAGKAQAGMAHADADLFVNAKVILTPLAGTDAARVRRAHSVWTTLGAQVIEMSAEAHDHRLAAVSHLPHLLAFAAMNGLARQRDMRDSLRLAGPGFRDFTRIAGSDPTVWRDILLANRDEVLQQSREFRHALDQLEAALRADTAPALESLLEGASTLRSQWRLNDSDNDNDSDTSDEADPP